MLRFTPYAWAKLTWFCLYGEDEIGGFGVTDAEDLLLVRDVAIVKQLVTPASVDFDDDAVADLFDQQVELGRKPCQFARIWLHTHPGDSAHPSGTDEETFARAFGGCDWAVMGILARTGKTYARLRFNAGPGGELRIGVDVDASAPFPASDHDAWAAEYAAKVHPLAWPGDVLGEPVEELLAWGVDELERLDELAALDAFGADGCSDAEPSPADEATGGLP